MKDFGKVRSSIRPESIEIDEYSVYQNSSIKEIQVTDPESGIERIEYEFNKIRYTKNEFILMQMDEITDTQVALCEIYESLLK